MESLQFKSPETFIDFHFNPSSGEDLPRLKNPDFFFAPAQIDSNMPTALVQGSIAIQYVHLLRKNLPLHWDILTWDPEQDSPDLFLEKAMEADVIIGGKIPLQSWPKLPKLKMFQIPWTGYDFCSPQTMPQGIPVCNCYEHETTIAEYVMLAMLEW